MTDQRFTSRIVAEAILEQGLMHVFVVKGGTIVDASKGCDELFGRSLAQTGGPFLDLVTPSERQAVAQALDQAIQSGMRTQVQFTAERADADFFEAEAQVVRVGAPGDAMLVVSIADVTSHRRSMAELRAMAFVDPLTRLSNRALFLDRLRTTLAQAHRQGGAFGVIVADLDGFKSVNDRHGHEGGDAVLKTLAVRLAGALRDTDTLARMGGDEFAVILPRLGRREDAALVAGRMVTKACDPLAVRGAPVQIGISVGIATWPENGDDAETLVIQADSAMYAAKKGGKSHYRFAESPVDAAMTRYLQDLNWRDTHNVGITVMDEQHRHLANLINQLGAALRTDEDKQSVWTLFNALADFARVHFTTEEALMQRCGYADAARHRADHRRLLDDLLSLSINFDNQSITLTTRYLQDWLFRHIEADDRPLALELARVGIT